MLKTDGSLIIDEIHKTSYVQCIVDTTNKLKRIANNLINDVQLVISCSQERNLKILDHAKNTADKVLNVFSSSEENINIVKHNFLKAYELWLEEFLLNNDATIKNTISKSNVKNKPKDVIEIGDSNSSESDIEIVNEIKYLGREKWDTDDEDSISCNERKDVDCIENESVQIIPCDSDSITSTTDDSDAQSKTIDSDNSNSDSDATHFSSALNVSNSIIPTNINISSDTKLNSKCIVILHRLTQEEIDRFKKITCRSKSKKLLNDEFLRLINLDALEVPRQKKRLISIGNSSTSNDNNSSSSVLSRNYRAKKKNKKFKRSSSTSSVTSFYSSSDEGINNNENITYNNDLDAGKLLINEERAKQQLLKSDDSTDVETEENDTNYKINNENEKEKNEKRIQQRLNSNSSSSENDKREKAAWMKDKLLNFKLHEINKKEKQVTDKTAVNKKSDSDTDSDFAPIIRRKRRSNQFNNVQSTTSTDSDFTNSSLSNDSDSDDCQIVKGSSQLSAISETGSLTNTNINGEEQVLNNTITPSKPTGRRNIRKVYDDEEIAEGTRRAGKDEENRLQRLAEYNKQIQISLTEKNKEEDDTLILDYDLEKKVELIKVDRGLVKFLKPHQAEGVKFLWESCFETLEQIRNSEGSGCVLAHCMGLGKTFQIVTLVHTILVNKAIGVNTVMVVCPLNTILNWVEEFDMWLKNTVNKTKIRVHDLTQTKKISTRIKQLKFWHDLGGVLVISYDMFRSFTSHDKKLTPQDNQKLKSYLLSPGADFVVCDEGHILKNENSQIANRMKSIRTKRRVILTGTPLQNNLSEYHCMVQFVKPNLLGSKDEFQNRFGNPIVNGQFGNSTPQDVKLMKHRAHVLHRMLEGCVQRRDYSVLKPLLPPKQEYVILLRLSDLQIEMYRFFIENIVRNHVKQTSLFKNYHEIKRLISHPKVFQLKHKTSKKSLKKFNSNSNANVMHSPNNGILAEEEYWWSQFVKAEQAFDFTHSFKLIFLYGILERCKKEEDKILVFSQCLYTLDLIEIFLKQIDSQAKENGFINNPFNFQDEWKCGLDYFRLDGNVNPDKRNAMYKTFNNPDNKRARLFLISTKAGGLGVNLIGANRVVIFDPSWNPSNDLQCIFRIFRFGQRKPCYIYRLLSAGTMEQKIYNRQVTKLSLSLRVLDEQQIQRHYRDSDLSELYKLETLDDEPILNVPRDHVLADVFLKYKKFVYQSFEHDSLLENKEEEELDEDERKQAWLDYQQEKLAEEAKANQRKRALEKPSEPPTENSLPSVSNTDSIIDDIFLSLSNLAHTDLA